MLYIPKVNIIRLSKIEQTVTISRTEYESLLSSLASLQEEIRLLKNGNKSKTSHRAPSSDIGRSNGSSLREKSGLKSGGQIGHEGNTLQMHSIPDKQEHHDVNYCNHCSQNLENTSATVVGKRQEIVIPPVAVEYVEHVIYSKTCCRCNKVTQSNFPANITAPIQYGGNVKAMVSYLSVYQYLPMNRIVDILKTIYGIELSEGTVANILTQMARNAAQGYQMIQQRIEQSKVVGSDETGSKIAGQKGWFHTWQNDRLTFIAASLNRGYQTVAQYFADGFKKAVYISDCWAAQLKVAAMQHQLCLVHLLRELNNFEAALQCKWSTELKQLFKEAIALKKNLNSLDYITTPKTVIAIQQKLKQLLQINLENPHQKLKAFISRLQKHEQSILTFLFFEKVPYDNNGSERAIRNIKVKTKVSTNFRTFDGAQQFAIIRSVADTAIKNNQNVFLALIAIANFIPE